MANQTDPSDPFAAWREWMNQSERQWNAFLNEAMATDEFSRSMGRGMDLFLNAQGQMNEALGRILTSLNLPTRTDILGLADRLAAIEERLLGIELQLNASEAMRAGANHAGAAASTLQSTPERPPRTRKPATGP